MFYNQPFLVNPNPICRSFRDATHAEWVKSLKGALADLHAYVKAHHTTGLVWSKTVSNKTVLKQVTIHASSLHIFIIRLFCFQIIITQPAQCIIYYLLGFHINLFLQRPTRYNQLFLFSTFFSSIFATIRSLGITQHL